MVVHVCFSESQPAAEGRETGGGDGGGQKEDGPAAGAVSHGPPGGPLHQGPLCKYPHDLQVEDGPATGAVSHIPPRGSLHQGPLCKYTKVLSNFFVTLAYYSAQPGFETHPFRASSGSLRPSPISGLCPNFTNPGSSLSIPLPSAQVRDPPLLGFARESQAPPVAPGSRFCCLIWIYFVSKNVTRRHNY